MVLTDEDAGEASPLFQAQLLLPVETIIYSVLFGFVIHIPHTGSQEKISTGEGEHRVSTNCACTLGHSLFG